MRAAGGVPWRMVEGGPEVLVVHRERYDDWSFPKGKLDPGEGWLAAAVREVLEETGLVTVPGAALPGVAYTDHRGRPKQVRYWELAVVVDLGFTPGDEIAERRWIGVDDAPDLLSHAGDHLVLEALRTRIPR